MAETTGRELGWGDAIEHDGSDFTLLEPGEYPFRVVKFERKRFGGSAKLPACNQAALTLDVGDAEASTTITHNLFLHSKTEGLLCAFFRSIGARKHGERIVMDWSKVPGATGRCKVGRREFAGKDGTMKQANQVEKFLDPGEAEAVAASVGPASKDDIPF